MGFLRSTPQTSTHTNNWRILTVLLVGIFMVLLDATIVNVALPNIQHGLHTGSSTLEWIAAGYSLVLGLALVPSGRLGDSIGHRRMFLIGLALFTTASLFCSLAQNPAEIIGARLLQGLGAGMFQPAVTSFIQLLFQGRERGKAFSMLGSTIGLGAATGPVLGGLLVHFGGDVWGWRLVFLVNVPIGLVVWLLARKMLPRSKQLTADGKRLDLFGVGLLTVALLLVLVPLVEGQRLGWPLWTYGSFVLSLPLFAGLWAWERKQEQRGRTPLLAVNTLRTRSFAAGLPLVFIYFAAFTCVSFTLSIFWQAGLARGALAAGLAIAPLPIGSMLAASQSHKLSQRLGRRVLSIGCALVALALVAMLVVLKLEGTAISAWELAVPLLLVGAGSGLFIAPSQDFVLADVPHRDAGSAAGMVAMAQDASTAFGVAIVGTVLFSGVYTGSGVSSAAVFSQNAQNAIAVILGGIVVVWLLIFLLPKRTDEPATE